MVATSSVPEASATASGAIASSATAAAPVSPVDRLGFTLFLAIALHAIVILGVGFSVEQSKPVARTLEVTLAQYQSEQAPEQADFIAQHDQQGSGTSENKALPTTREQALFQANQSQPVAARALPSPVPDQAPAPQPTPAPAPEKAAPTPATPEPETREIVVTRAEAPRQQTNGQVQKAPPPAQATAGSASALLARSLEIASLEAKLDLYQQQHANQPRVRRLYSASTRKAFDAAYLDSWRRKVERIGNLNYPEEARRRELYGNLRLLVVIRPDGSLDKVDVLKTSGHKLLDDAAMRIVRLAAPFAPFPPELRKHADRVEIIRTWKFERARFGINS